MFSTQDSELVGVPGLFGDGRAHWQAVSRMLRTHWYHLAVRTEQDGRSTEFTLMVDTEHKLQECLISQDAEFAIIDIHAVIPAWMSKSDGWAMERVQQVTIGCDEHGCGVTALEVEGGAVYVTSHQPGFVPGMISNPMPIFMREMIGSKH